MTTISARVVLTKAGADLANPLVPPREIVIFADLRGELDLVQRRDRGILGRRRCLRAQYGSGGKRVNFVIGRGQYTNARLADFYLQLDWRYDGDAHQHFA